MVSNEKSKDLVNSAPSGDEEPSAVISPKPQRRVFSPEYKLEILEKIEACRPRSGEVGELLRREGLYATQVSKWRKEAEEALLGNFAKKRGPRP